MLTQGMQLLVTRDDAGETVTLLYGSTLFSRSHFLILMTVLLVSPGWPVWKAPWPPFIESFFLKQTFCGWIVVLNSDFSFYTCFVFVHIQGSRLGKAEVLCYRGLMESMIRPVGRHITVSETRPYFPRYLEKPLLAHMSPQGEADNNLYASKSWSLEWLKYISW